ncbi:TPA_asm: coat protein [ssRNA phage Gerhypos.4_17]|uniref:Coat protein n=2 Tax=Fiersviridae TaxID=2842319 RepID=A0A8S5L274_9VIRU|nr:coat protein [ssRNA phage Gerhypos.4_17]QDH91525.1 MAG: hypothetical protein H4Bulk46476_000003 [Leviviridae sp.]DAD51587.1 TPA_asm: coat protein [ssRNA phage Gerhypos.4_17]
MATVTSLVVNDGQATPVAHTFLPAKTTADYALFEDRVSGIYMGFNKWSVLVKRPDQRDADRNARGRNILITQTLEFPQLEIISGTTASGYVAAPSVAFRPQVEVRWKLPEQCTQQNRADLHALLTGHLTHASNKAVIVSLDMFY